MSIYFLIYVRHGVMYPTNIVRCPTNHCGAVTQFEWSDSFSFLPMNSPCKIIWL